MKTKKQRKALAWATVADRLVGPENTMSREIKQAVRRVEKRKRQQFAKTTRSQP